MFARRREPQRAFAYASTMHKDEYTYGALLNACAKVSGWHAMIVPNGFACAPALPTCFSAVQASHPPYDLPREFAEQALQIFKDMQAAGIAPNAVHYWTLMDCQVFVICLYWGIHRSVL